MRDPALKLAMIFLVLSLTVASVILTATASASPLLA
ncbi:MAG: hypothetical protein QOJ91_308 [Sphingomonadales bacterium]|jgi:hypothetical protein|nr:hypothetical protein [Sphingomonadales bacterium]